MGPGQRHHLAMDPINYLPHGSQRHSSHNDPVHGSAGSWAAGAHGFATPGWPPNSSASPLYFTQAPPRPPPSLDVSHFGLHGALPHPDRSLRGAQQQQEALAGLPTPPGLLGAALHSVTGRPNAAATSQGGVALHSGDLSAQGLGTMALQPQSLVNMGPSGATSETHSLHNSLFTSPDRLANAYGQQSVSHFSTPHPPYTFTPSRRAGTSSSPTTPAAQRSGVSTTSSVPTPRVNENSGLPSPVSDRRRQSYTRVRRYLSARQTVSDHVEDDNRPVMAESVDGRPSRRAGHGSHHIPLDEAAMRQLQLARGAAASKMIASRVALQSLQSVHVSDLPDNERMCVICYNDYGVQSPEGINEAPLRLPKCKHVFGDHCIKKWFEDSDSCPYCRDKLPSEPKPNYGSARTFLNMMRLRGFPPTTGNIPEHLLSQIMGGSLGDDDLITAIAHQGRAAERRPPPDDAAGEDQRRTRQRRASPSPPHRLSSAPGGAGHAMTSAASAQDLFGSSQPRPNPWPATSLHTASYASYQASAPPPTISVMPHPRAGTHGHGQGVPGGSILERAFAQQLGPDYGGQLLNPLRGHSRASLAGEPNITASNIRPTAAVHPVTFRPPRQAGVDDVEQQVSSPMEATPSSPFGPNRNRPW